MFAPFCGFSSQIDSCQILVVELYLRRRPDAAHVSQRCRGGSTARLGTARRDAASPREHAARLTVQAQGGGGRAVKRSVNFMLIREK